MKIDPPKHACPPQDWEDVLRKDLYAAIQIERSKWTEPGVLDEYPDVVSPTEQTKDLSPPKVVTSAAAINNGWCKIFTERVLERLDWPDTMAVTSDGDRHTWIAYDGRCYDAQTPTGVGHPTALPIYK